MGIMYRIRACKQNSVVEFGRLMFQEKENRPVEKRRCCAQIVPRVLQMTKKGMLEPKSRLIIMKNVYNIIQKAMMN